MSSSFELRLRSPVAWRLEGPERKSTKVLGSPSTKCLEVLPPKCLEVFHQSAWKSSTKVLGSLPPKCLEVLHQRAWKSSTKAMVLQSDWSGSPSRLQSDHQCAIEVLRLTYPRPRTEDRSLVRSSLDRLSSVSRPFLDRTLDQTLDRTPDQSEVLRNACSLASAAAAFRALTPSLLSPAEGRGEGGSVAWASSSESEFSSS